MQELELNSEKQIKLTIQLSSSSSKSDDKITIKIPRKLPTTHNNSSIPPPKQSTSPVPKPITKYSGNLHRLVYRPLELLLEEPLPVETEITVYVEQKFLTIDNPAIAHCMLWGGLEKCYTDDSDIAAILWQMGVRATCRATFRITNFVNVSVSVDAGGIVSRTWPLDHPGHGIQLVSWSPVNEIPMKFKRKHWSIKGNVL